METDAPIDYYNVDILRICCKDSNKAAISDYQHLVKYDKKIVVVKDLHSEVMAVSFLNLSGRANNTNDDAHIKANDSTISNDIVQLNAYSIGWVLNNQVNSCMRCNTSFTLASWRHHCRLCGYLTCHNCSQYLVGIYINVIEKQTPRKILLEPHGSRVCVVCYEKKGGPDAINYFSNPALEGSANPLRKSINGPSPSLPPMENIVRRNSGNNLDSMTASARRSFSQASPAVTNPLSRQNSGTNLMGAGAGPGHPHSIPYRRASAPATTLSAADRSVSPVGIAGGRTNDSPASLPGQSSSGHDGTLPAGATRGAASKLFRSASDSVSVPVPGSGSSIADPHHQYTAGSYDNPIEKVNLQLSKTRSASLHSEVPPATAPSRVDKAKLAQKFQEAKDAETRQYQERVQSIKRDPSRQVSSNTRQNIFVVRDQEKKAGGGATSTSASTAMGTGTEDLAAVGAEASSTPPPAAVESVEVEEVHAFEEQDADGPSPSTPEAAVEHGSSPSPPSAPHTNISYISDLSPLPLEVAQSDVSPLPSATTTEPPREQTLEALASPFSPQFLGEEDLCNASMLSMNDFVMSSSISPMSERNRYSWTGAEATVSVRRTSARSLLSDGLDGLDATSVDDDEERRGEEGEGQGGEEGGFFDSPFAQSKLTGVVVDSENNEDAEAEAESTPSHAQ